MASEGYVPLLLGPTASLSMPVLDSMLMPHLTPEELEQYRAAWNLPDYVPDLEIVKLEGVDHWITHQATELLSEHIVTFEARLAKE
jgi:pimeloyl-ACP methyl ester carboxylesterase